MNRRRILLAAGLLVLGGLAVAPEAAATHAYDCDVVGDPTVDGAYCAAHCAWDVVTGFQPKRLRDCLE